MSANPSDHCSIARLQRVIAIGSSTAVLAIEEIECDSVDATRRQLVRKANHKRAHLAGAGSMSQNQRDSCSVSSSRLIDIRGYALVFVDVYAKLLWHLSVYFGKAVLLITSAICLLCLRL